MVVFIQGGVLNINKSTDDVFLHPPVWTVIHLAGCLFMRLLSINVLCSYIKEGLDGVY